VREKKPFILCIQETKLPVFDAFDCLSIWGDDKVDFSYQRSTGASGGLVTLWDVNEVEVWSTASLDHVLAVTGRFLKSGEQFTVFNVYAPCDTSRQHVLWNALSSRIEALAGRNVCVCGDFNAIRSAAERRTVSGATHQASIDNFNGFVVNNNLVDLPLRGRTYTWYRGDGRTMSRIDRFLLTDNWVLTWPNCIQLAVSRGLSDHCPLVLSVDTQNWGPKPVRMLKCWADIPGYDSFVRDKWRSFQISGWGSFVLKEKLKSLKSALKEWHHHHSRNLPARILPLKDKIASLDLKGESSVLSDDEIRELHGLSEDLFSLSRVNSSICWQQSRVQWLREGDANSKYFHRIMTSKRSRNAIPFFLVNGVLIEGVQNVRSAVFTHYQTQFQATQHSRPSMEALEFRTLSISDGVGLVSPFTVEEVKTAVWDVESFKCPGPDGISFGFIKDFWDILKDDVMRFLVEFHRNGRLAKGINSTFIALIPKVANPHRLNDFRPISLVGSTYKILAKVLANRLRSVIGEVISES